jgi:hypothetical protein
MLLFGGCITELFDEEQSRWLLLPHMEGMDRMWGGAVSLAKH